MSFEFYRHRASYVYQVSSPLKTQWLTASEIRHLFYRGKLSSFAKVVKPSGIWECAGFYEEKITVAKFIDQESSKHNRNSAAGGESDLLVLHVAEEIHAWIGENFTQTRSLEVTGDDYLLRIYEAAPGQIKHVEFTYSAQRGRQLFGAVTLPTLIYEEFRCHLLPKPQGNCRLMLCWSADNEAKKPEVTALSVIS